MNDKHKFKKSSLVPFNKKVNKSRGVLDGAPLTQEGICQVYQLIEFLKKEQSISVEKKCYYLLIVVYFRYQNRRYFSKNGLFNSAARTTEFVESRNYIRIRRGSLQHSWLCLSFEGVFSWSARSFANWGAFSCLLPNSRYKNISLVSYYITQKAHLYFNPILAMHNGKCVKM